MKRKPTKIVEEEDEEIESSSDSSSEEEEDNVPMQSIASELYPDEALLKQKPRKQVLAKEMGKESEFTSSRHAFSSNKLGLADLLDEDQVNAGLLKKQLSTKNDSKLLLQPLVKPVEQQKAERKLGYENASETVTEHWQDAVLFNKKQKLSFPLKQVVDNVSIRNVTKSTLPSELEDQVAAVLQSSGLASDKDIIESEELARNEDYEMDDTAKAKMRALLFYAEQKAKRVSKIKSKTFRKLRKKKLHREEEEALEKLRETDPELAKEEEERQAMLRAKERASLRQKNTSKRMRELGKRNKGAGEDGNLQNKMKSIHAARGSDDESSDDEDEEDLEEMAQRHLDTFEREIQHETKGLAGMKFMQRALERDHQQAKQDAVQLLKRLRNEGDDDVVEGEVQGKRQFGMSKVEQRKKHQAMPATAKLFEEVYEEEEDKPVVAAVKKPEEEIPAASVVEEENNDNPWLSSTQVTLRNKKSSSGSAAVMQVDKVMGNLPAKPQQEQQHQDQREIVKRAFANVAEEDFAKEKKELEEKDEEASAAVPTAGAGWGSWTGLGVKEKKKPAPLPARFQDKKKLPQQKPNVIVSTRTNKLHRKYQVEDIPYPFTSREQYEKSLQDAVGKEWNTVKQHEKKVLPAVQVRAGTIIQPIQLPKGHTSQGAKQVVKQPKKRFASRKAMS